MPRQGNAPDTAAFKSCKPDGIHRFRQRRPLCRLRPRPAYQPCLPFVIQHAVFRSKGCVPFRYCKFLQGSAIAEHIFKIFHHRQALGQFCLSYIPAALEGMFPQGGYAFRYGKHPLVPAWVVRRAANQICPIFAVKHPVHGSKRPIFLWNGNGSQIPAAIKGHPVNPGYAGWERKARQAGAPLESIHPNGVQGFRQHKFCQAPTAIKGIGRHFFHTPFQLCAP